VGAGAVLMPPLDPPAWMGSKGRRGSCLPHASTPLQQGPCRHDESQYHELRGHLHQGPW